MPVITFNAFSFLQKKLKEKQIKFSNVTMTLKLGTRARDLVRQVHLEPYRVLLGFKNKEL